MKRVCFKCLANKTNSPFTAVDAYAAWRATLLTHQMYMAMCMTDGAEVSAIFSIPGLKLHHVTIDLMHASYLGILQYLLGCILWELAFVDMGGRLASLVVRMCCHSWLYLFGPRPSLSRRDKRSPPLIA